MEEQVTKAIQTLIIIEKLVTQGTPDSPIFVTFITHPFKGDFNPVDKYGTSLFKTATDGLPEKQRFFFISRQYQESILAYQVQDFYKFLGN